ncbi:Voltage-dependent L-type calcium channel subunit alpha-1S (FGalpha1S) (Voltage-gated calcium channel subunit alpha Cav1.1) [Durusdinium trenchii]|uniref:Voltage-dependent L-type calcium channel subunit alpha-1S (FGalpha1S) (Voltage-gated calcium channel subunit alpha Cav1.1) n=1 Tax=Durusdinium trenchii TaxID=1381693 RepID=A0ABP0Q696_9DINO
MAEQPEPNLESVPSAYGRQVSNRRPQVHVGGSFLHMSGERLGAVTSQEKCKTCMNSVYMANFMALVVLIDAVCTVADIDATAQQQQSGDLVQVISDLCLTAYSLEVLGLLYLYGFHLLKDWMMLLDVVIVVCGWGEKILAAAIASSLGFRISVLRALRLVRIFRLMRLLKRIRPLRELHKLVMMMATCLRTLLWSFMLCFVVMTVWAMLMVETIHPSLEEMYLADELGSCDTQCIRSMSSVMDANLLIFKTVIAGDSWGEIAVPVIQKHPGTAIIFVGSLLTLVFGVLNLIVAVVVDTFADARLNDVQNLAEEMEDEIEHDRKALAKLFARIDKDGSGQLTLQEMIEGARQDPGFQSRLRVMDIDEHDLEQLFQMIDRDQSGTIEVAEFIGPLSRWAHDSKTAPRFIKYHMLQTMQMQEDLWELSVECFNQLNTKIEALAGRMAGEYPAAEGPPKSREMSFEGAAPSEEVMTHIGSLDSRASQGSHITETMMSMDVSGNVKVQLDGFDSVLSPSASPVVTKETAPREMLDQPKASPDPDLWAPKSTEQQFREKSSVLEGLLESAMSKLEGKLDLLLESRGRRHELLASPEGHNALSEAIGKPKSKKKGKILHPEAFRNMYMDRGKRLSLIPPPPSSPPSSGDPSPGCAHARRTTW